MHSASLRGTDFEIVVAGKTISHADFFADFSKQRRVGLVAPQRVDGVGAATLLMAHVTAFYDLYRAEGGDFFAYPDYFTFQYQSPVAHYSMLDVWPIQKNVYAGQTHVDRLNAITDRGINTLIVPDCEPQTLTYERPQLESAGRTIDNCYLYAFDGELEDADVVICCDKEPIGEWALTVFGSAEIADNQKVASLRQKWEAAIAKQPKFTQSFRRISLDQALARLQSPRPIPQIPSIPDNK